MEQRRTKLVEEENTIYEIDMECVRKKRNNADNRRQHVAEKDLPLGAGMRICLEIGEILCYDKNQ